MAPFSTGTNPLVLSTAMRSLRGGQYISGTGPHGHCVWNARQSESVSVYSHCILYVFEVLPHRLTSCRAPSCHYDCRPQATGSTPLTLPLPLRKSVQDLKSHVADRWSDSDARPAPGPSAEHATAQCDGPSVPGIAQAVCRWAGHRYNTAQRNGQAPAQCHGPSQSRGKRRDAPPPSAPPLQPPLRPPRAVGPRPIQGCP